MNGTAVETVASSWIEALGGVSMCWILRTPPGFCAQADPVVATSAAANAAGMSHPVRIFMLFPPMRRANGHGVDCSTRGLLTNSHRLNRRDCEGERENWQGGLPGPAA